MKLPGRIALTPELPAAILQAHLENQLHRDYLSVQVRIGRLPRPVLEVLSTPDLDVVTSVSILGPVHANYRLANVPCRAQCKE